MEHLEQLEERARLLSQTLVDKRETDLKLRQTIDRLEAELTGLRHHAESLERQVEQIRRELERAVAERDSLARDHKRLHELNQSNAEEVRLLKRDYAEVREIKDKAVTMFEALVAELESSLGDEAPDAFEDKDEATDTAGPATEEDGSGNDDDPATEDPAALLGILDGDDQIDWNVAGPEPEREGETVMPSDHAGASAKAANQPSDDKPNNVSDKLIERIKLVSRNNR